MVGKVSKKTSPIEIKILFLLSATLFCLWLSVSLGTPFLSFVGYVMRIIYTTRVHRTIFLKKLLNSSYVSNLSPILHKVVGYPKSVE